MVARMFNLNDSRWGRGDDKSRDSGKPDLPVAPESDEPVQPPPRQRRKKYAPALVANSGPPDLDELWRDVNRKLGGLFGRPHSPAWRQVDQDGGFQPDMKSAGIGAGLILALCWLIWLGTGFFIVKKGSKLSLPSLANTSSTVSSAGFNWRLPYPIQRHELVFVTQIRSVDVGRDIVLKATGLRESAMLTEDENILDIKFSVQYRLSDARAFLFESKDPAAAVVQAAETAVREVLGQDEDGRGFVGRARPDRAAGARVDAGYSGPL
jgi:membrane protease subunit HflK